MAGLSNAEHTTWYYLGLFIKYRLLKDMHMLHSKFLISNCPKIAAEIFGYEIDRAYDHAKQLCIGANYDLLRRACFCSDEFTTTNKGSMML